MKTPHGRERQSGRTAFTAALIWAALSTVAWSQTQAPSLEQQVQELSRKVEALQQQSARPAAEPQNPSKQAQIAAGPEGLGFKSADGNFSLQFRGLVQTDARFYLGGNYGGLETNQFLVRRARPILTGTLYGFTSFKITPEFASNGKTLLYDAFVDVAPWSFVKLRAGKFKPPIGLEHLQEDACTPFVERGLTSNLVPQRDTGFQLYGDLPGGLVGYAVAVTNGVADSASNTSSASPLTTDTDGNNGKEVVGRLTLKPFKSASAGLLKGLHLGIGASFAGGVSAAPTYSSPGQLSLFTAATGAAPDGKHTRLAPELDWYYGPMRVYGEWIRSSQVWAIPAAGSALTHNTITNQAGQAGFTYVLTGENASYAGVKPVKPFDPRAGTWGAFELTGRYGVLYLASDNFVHGVTTAARSVQRATSGGAGINWYWNNFLMMKADYEETLFDKGAATGDRLDEKFLVTRLQLAF